MFFKKLQKIKIFGLKFICQCNAYFNNIVTLFTSKSLILKKTGRIYATLSILNLIVAINGDGKIFLQRHMKVLGLKQFVRKTFNRSVSMCVCKQRLRPLQQRAVRLVLYSFRITWNTALTSNTGFLEITMIAPISGKLIIYKTRMNIMLSFNRRHFNYSLVRVHE